MADFAACLAMDRDPEVMKYVSRPWDNPERHKRFLRERIQKSLGSGLGYWSLFARPQPEQFLGWVLLIPYDGVGPDIEIGWRLNRSAWGKGYATEAARPIIEHAFRTVGLRRIVADIDPGNSASMRVSEKLGLAFIGDGEHDGMPCKCYAMTREDFFAANPGNP
jgi:RimJ/RimL family protein N-acetyltransferase